MINMSEMIFDVDFSSSFKVKRTLAVNSNHRTTYTEVLMSFHGIITMADAKTLEMLPEADRFSGAINVYTKERLYITANYTVDTVSKQYVSDVVQFNDSNYKVQSVLENGRFGFYKATCTLLERS